MMIKNFILMVLETKVRRTETPEELWALKDKIADALRDATNSFELTYEDLELLDFQTNKVTREELDDLNDRVHEALHDQYASIVTSLCEEHGIPKVDDDDDDAERIEDFETGYDFYRVWDNDTGELLGTYSDFSDIQALCFDPHNTDSTMVGEENDCILQSTKGTFKVVGFFDLMGDDDDIFF